MATSDRDYAEKLVSEVKKRPLLYNPRLPGKKDMYLVALGWREVAEAIGSTPDAARKRWQNLRGTYSKCITANNPPEGPPPLKKRNFYLSSQMDFLKEHLNYVPGYERTKVENTVTTSESLWDDLQSYEVRFENMEEAEDSVEHKAFSALDNTQCEEECDLPGARGVRRELSLEDTAAMFLRHKMDRREGRARSNSILEYFKGLVPHIEQLKKKKQRSFLSEVTQTLFQKLDEQEEEDTNVH